MKHTFLKVSVLFCALSFAFSCSKDNDMQKPVGGDAGADVLLSLSDTDVHPLGDKFRVAYSSDSDWELTGVENWIDISKKRGSAGTTVLDITVEPFPADSDTKKRDASLSFRKSSDSSVEIFTISQRAAYIDLDSTSFSIDWHNDERAGAVESNIGWKISCDSDWITPSWSADWTSEAVDTAGVADITFIVGNNFSGRNNETKIVIEPVAPADYNLDDDVWSGVVAALKREISVSQNYLIFLLEESSDTKPFSELGADFVDANASAVADEHSVRQEITVYSETMDWDYSSPDTSWLQVALNSEKNTEDAGKTEQYGRPIYKTEVKMTVIEPNPTTKVRSVEIVFSVKSNGESYDKSVGFSQNAYTFDVPESDYTFINNPADKDGDGKVLRINTTGPWKIEDIPDWLKVSQTSGIGIAEVTLQPKDQNLNFNDPDGTNERNCTLKITTDGLNDSNFGAECKASQDGFIFDVNWDEALNNLPRLNKDRYTVAIESSGEWEVTLSAGDGDNENDHWLHVSPYEGDSGTTTITVQPNKANPDKDKPRTKHVTITSKLHDAAGIKDTNAVKTFPVTQDKHVFQIKKSDSEDAEDFVPEPFAAYEAASQKFVLRCSAPWKIEGMPDWMSVSSLSGTGEINPYPTITLNTYDNSGEDYRESRSATLNILSDINDDGSYADKLTMTISQDAFVFDVKVDPDYDSQTSLSAISSDSYSLNINTTSGAGWNVSAPEWFACSWDKGSGNGAVSGNSTADIDFSFANNGYLYFRTGEVRVSSAVVDASYSFPVAQDAYVFDSEDYNDFVEFDEMKSKAQPQQMTFDCLGAWTIESKPSWIEVSPASGSGNPELSVTAVATNASDGRRPGTVIVNSTVGGVTHRKNIAVSQRGYQWEVTGTEDITASLEGAKQTVSIKSSGAWRASIVDRETSKTADWVTVPSAEGNAGRDNVSTSEISVSKNYTTSNRKATVTFRSDDYTSSNGFSDDVSISQEPYIFNVSSMVNKQFGSISDLTASFDGLESTGGFAEPDCGGASWLSASLSGGVLTLTAAPNYTTASNNSATVTLRSKDYSKNNELSETITITQSAYVFTVSAMSNKTLGAISSLTSEISGLESTGGFSEPDCGGASWLSASLAGGVLTLTAEPNYTTASRPATVTLRSKDYSNNNELSKTITVTQDAYEWNVSAVPASHEFDYNSSLTKTFSGLKSTGGFITESNAAWLTATISNGTLALKASENTAYESRSATVEIKSKDWSHNNAFKTTITVTQKAAPKPAQ